MRNTVECPGQNEMTAKNNMVFHANNFIYYSLILNVTLINMELRIFREFRSVLIKTVIHNDEFLNESGVEI